MISGQTWYEASAPSLAFPSLGGQTRECEVAILGGGFAGLAAARGLQERGIKNLVLLEAQGVGHGASGRNGGFVFGGFSRGPAALLRDLGAAKARTLYGLTREAVATIRRRIETLGIECERVEGGALWVDWFKTPASLAGLRAEAALLREQFGVHWDEIDAAQVRQWLDSERYGPALLERDAFHFHPLKYARGLAAAIAADGGQVFERSGVRVLRRLAQGWELETDGGGRVRAQQLVLAGGGYLRGVAPCLTRARLPIATYVMCTEPLPESLQPVRCTAAIYDNRFAFDYYRKLESGRLLWGGRISILEREPARITELLRQDLLKVYPQLHGVQISHAWGGLMSYARHQMPQLGELAPGLWYAQSFGGHGVAPTTVAGELLAEAISRKQPLDALWQRYGLSPVYGPAGLLAAQAQYSWAEFRDWLRS
ncbi:NAD(P)/FAD-dependent oxidoreductase [Inhella proteolytica]|uniref:FAD-binding oxidoreductase n=1 Tax=Inhella proteolytica TaxID=2795029 RepID=A0A931IZI8_9BURK|nr:FAD-binding oxidoreductase [Inhella proteolytica]MBH9575606.1 FAD-binding oxidoreductase [Inhella proteolytica]